VTKDSNETSENSITTKQARAIACLLSERTTGAAARKAQVTERTLYTWLGEPAFRAALRSAEKSLLETVTRRLSVGQSLALDALEALIQKAKYESTRRQAAIDWLNLSLKFIDTVNIDQRLTALEAAIYDKK
jgi:hypothetical protein